MERLYGPFYRRQAICFYIDESFSGAEASSTQDANGFVVREYQLGEQLEPLRRPVELERHHFHRVTWNKIQDYPSISKYYGLFEESVYSALCDDERLEFINHSGIKIGGWPTPIQSDQRYPNEFDLQIDMTDNYVYADSGIGYLSGIRGIWHVMFECC